MVASDRLVLPGRFLAAVFDNDGLLVDSEPAWAAAEGALFARRGAAFGPADVADTHGRSVEATVVLYAASLGSPATEIHDELMADIRRRYETEVPLRPGARELIEALAGRMRIAVASNSPTDLVELGLRRHGLHDRFEVILSAPDVGRPKPEPDVYVEACRRLGVAPSDAIAFEDSAPGVAAAKAAGLICVGVPERDAVDLSEADIVLTSLRDVVVTTRLG